LLLNLSQSESASMIAPVYIHMDDNAVTGSAHSDFGAVGISKGLIRSRRWS